MKPRESQSVEVRLSALERENRRLKLGVLVVVVILGAIMLMGTGKPHQNQEQRCDFVSNKDLSNALQNACGEIRAAKFVLVGPNKNIWAELFVTDNYPNLVFYGTDGKPTWSAQPFKPVDGSPMTQTPGSVPNPPPLQAPPSPAGQPQNAPSPADQPQDAPAPADPPQDAPAPANP
ncbi:MAG: hypothetical protein C4523_17075 [Myxococcales bacterium]|nr:MAG: hypothetical protein C4523_17075 [Myxococcales bacterium]